MKGKLTYVLTCGLLLAALAGGSCVKQGLDLREQVGYVRIDLQWENGSVPEGSEFYFYNENGERVHSCICAAEGFRGTLPIGKYKIIVWNTDAENLELFGMDNYASAVVRVTADETAANRDGGYIAQPDNLLLASAFNEAEFMEVPYRDSVIMSASPKGLVKKVHLVFKVDNADAVKLVSGSLSGVSSGVQCSSVSCTNDPRSVNFAIKQENFSQTYDYSADISVLDLVLPAGGVSGSHVLTLDAVVDGVTYHMNIDLTGTIDDLLKGEWNGTIPIEIPLEVELKSIDGILSAEVKPWDNTGTGGGEIM